MVRIMKSITLDTTHNFTQFVRYTLSWRKRQSENEALPVTILVTRQRTLDDTIDESNPEMQVVSILPDTEDSNKESPKESRENGRTIRRNDGKLDRKSAKLLQDECKQQGDSGIMMACPLPILGTAYQINSSVASTTNTIGVLQPVNTIPIAPAQNKTITLTSGGKTLTLTGGTFQPGTQYVLSKLKGKFPTLVMADKKTAIAANQAEDAKGVQITKDQLAVASTSYQSPKNMYF